MRERAPGVGETYTAQVLLVPCPACGVTMGEKCYARVGRRRRLIGPHHERTTEAGRLDKMGRVQ